MSIKKGVLNTDDKNYPELLKSIDKPPEKLNYKGDFQSVFLENTLAVVGSRKMTSYGKMVTEKLVREVSSCGITIVSGFMYGVDALAHQTAIENNGKTIGVLPCGVDVIHPAYQKKLYQQLLRNGFFVSEYDDNMPPERWTYPKRNRITVGLSQATLVIEAAEKSGSIISAELAKKYNRKLFAVPGSVFSETSAGTNKLLKEGATPVTCAQDILSFFDKEEGTLFEEMELSPEESEIMEILKQSPHETDEIVRKTKKPATVVGETLSSLEMKGVIKKEGRLYYPL